MEKTLTHYGIKGMRWGVRRTEAQLRRARGPNAPRKVTKEQYEAEKKKAFEKAENKRLSKLSKEEYDAEKQSAIRSGNKNTIQQWKNRLTTSELREALDRIDLDRRLNSIDKKRVNNGQQRVTTAIKTVGSIAGLAGLAVGTYTTIAMINNTFNSKVRLPNIDGTYYKDQK